MKPEDYGDTIKQFWNMVWKKCGPENAVYYTEAYKNEIGFWHSYDYYVAQNSIMQEAFYKEKGLINKEGEFAQFNRKGKLIVKGYFEDGQPVDWLVGYDPETGKARDSIFFYNAFPLGRSIQTEKTGLVHVMNLDSTRAGTDTTYFNGKISSTGYYYSFFIKDSVWNYYYADGKLSATEVYNTGILSFSECFDTSGKKMDSCRVSKMPEFLKNKGKLWNYLRNHIGFPRRYHFKDPGVAAVIVEFIIDSNGLVRDIELIKSLHKAFDDEVLGAVKRMPRWAPATDHNRPINVRYTLPIRFADFTND